MNDFEWEKIYRNGCYNRCPYTPVFSFLFRNTKGIKDRTFSVLEVGCGTGNNLRFAALEGFSVYGLDKSESAIAYAKKWFQKESLEGTFSVADFTDPLPFDDCFFDFVIDRGSITYVDFKSARKTITEIYRVLKRGGKFFFNPLSEFHSGFLQGELNKDGTVSNIKKSSLQNQGDVYFYGIKDIFNLFPPFWKIEKINQNIQEQFFPMDYNSDMRVVYWEVICEKGGL